MSWDQSCAIMVKTILRPQALEALLLSLRNYGPRLPVWIGDDSPEPTPEIIAALRAARPHPWWEQVHYLCYPYDCGAGAVYNDLVRQIPQEAIILMDDDFRVPAKTSTCDLSRLVRPVKAGEFDLLGGACRRMPGIERQAWVGNWVEGANDNGQRWVRLDRAPFVELEKSGRPGRAECILNFFAATREALARCPWDEEQKVFRHEDWFLQARQVGLRIGYHPGVTIEHWVDRTVGEYNQLRAARLPQYIDRFVRKWGMAFIG